jgi:hypothetical protein
MFFAAGKVTVAECRGLGGGVVMMGVLGMIGAARGEIPPSSATAGAELATGGAGSESGFGEVITQAPRQQPSTHGAPRPNNTLMTLGFQMVTKLGAHIPDPAKACLLGPTNST